MRRNLWIVIVLGLFLRLFFLFQSNPVWWDGSIYIGMGRFIYSWGQLGIWEPIRPLVIPFLLGSAWKLGMNEIVIGRLIEIAFSLGAVYLTYLIGKRYRGEEEGLLAATIVCFTPVFFSFAFRLYTEIPSTFFALAAVYFFMKNEDIHAGIASGLAILTKFPQGIVFLVLVIFSLKNMKKAFRMSLFFFLTILPYLVINQIMQGQFYKPFLDGSQIIKHAGVWLFAKPWWFYFSEMLRQNFLYIFAFLGIIFLLKSKHKHIIALLLGFLAYFTSLAHKEPRFMILFLPYLAIFAATGIRKVFKQKAIFWIVLAISLTILFVNFGSFPNAYKTKEKFFNFLDGKEVNGEVLVSHPYINLYSSKKVTPIYYMVFDSKLARHWTEYIKENKKNIHYIFIDTCEGGMLCPPWDNDCELERENLILISENNFNKVFYEKRKECRYYIFENQNPSHSVPLSL